MMINRRNQFPVAYLFRPLLPFLLLGFLCIFAVEKLNAEPKFIFEPRETAIFAGGCFWCMEHTFYQIPGVVKVTSGFTGGAKKNPTYEEVSAGGTGHAEAVQVTYNPEKVSYTQLLNLFWHNIDPTVKDAQFCDHGSQYRSAIFYMTPDQQSRAEGSKNDLLQSGKFKTIYTEIVPASTFYRAEDDHQRYYIMNPVRYRFYRYQCGRDQRLKELWGTKKSK